MQELEDLGGAEPWRVPPLIVAIGSTAAVFLLFVTVGALSQTLNPAFGIWFTEAFIFLGVPFVMMRMGLYDPARFPGMHFPGWAPAALGFAFGLVNFFALVVPLQTASQALAPASWIEAFDSSGIFASQTPMELAIIVSGVVVAAPWCEEYFFRGVLQNLMTRHSGRPVLTVVATALLFSVMHFDPVGFLARLELGLLFGWLFWRTGSIWPSALAHAANNGISTLIYFFAQDEAVSGGKATAITRDELIQVALFTVMGFMLLAGLWLLVRSKPELLQRQQEAERALTPTRFWIQSWPWLAAALLSIGALWAADSRGVRLRWIDFRKPLPTALRQSVETRDSLDQMRERVRRGEGSVESYRDAREALIGRPQRKPQPAPIPDTAPPPVPVP